MGGWWETSSFPHSAATSSMRDILQRSVIGVNPFILHFTLDLLILPQFFGKTLIPLIIVFLGVGGKTSFPHSTEQKWSLGTNYQARKYGASVEELNAVKINA